MNAASEKPLEGCRVLIVEDEAILLFEYSQILLAAGAFIAGRATTVKGAIPMAKSEDFDCALIDVKLRDGDVYPVARIVRDRGKSIVFVTGTPGLPELRKEWPDAEILDKPTKAEELISALAKACKNRAQ
ncbi:MAG: response regulator [Rhodomicrobium sp.]